MKSRKSHDLGNPMIMSQPKTGNPLLDGSRSDRSDAYLRPDSEPRTLPSDEGQTIQSDHYEPPAPTKPVPVNISTLQKQPPKSLKINTSTPKKSSDEPAKSPAIDPIFHTD